MYPPQKSNLGLICAIIFASVAIAGSLVFFGLKLDGKDFSSKDIQAQISSGIESYIQQQQVVAQKAEEERNRPQLVEGDLSDDDAVLGDKDAPVTIVEFSDYQCPFCRVFYNETMPDLKKKYIDTGRVKLVFRDFPLDFHPYAIPAAMAAECARDLGDDEVYFAMHDKIFDGENKLGNGTVDIPREALSTYADELGLDVGKFDKCVDDEKFKDEVLKDLADGEKIGVNGTPGFIVGTEESGMRFSGARGLNYFEPLIEKALEEAD